MTTQGTTEDITIAVARSLFVQAYADFCEREKEDGNDTSDLDMPGGGEDWYDFAPHTSDAAFTAARDAIARIEAMNGANIEYLFRVALGKCERSGCKGRGKNGDHTPEAFGADLGMMLTGSGVSWFDDHVQFDLKMPLIEFHIFDRSEFGED